VAHIHTLSRRKEEEDKAEKAKHRGGGRREKRRRRIKLRFVQRVYCRRVYSKGGFLLLFQRTNPAPNIFPVRDLRIVLSEAEEEEEEEEDLFVFNDTVEGPGCPCAHAARSLCLSSGTLSFAHSLSH